MRWSEYSSRDNYATIAHHTIIVMPPPLLLCNIRPSQRIPKIPPTLGWVSSLNNSSLWLLAIVVYWSLLCSRYLSDRVWLLNAAAKLLLKTQHSKHQIVHLYLGCVIYIVMCKANQFGRGSGRGYPTNAVMQYGGSAVRGFSSIDIQQIFLCIFENIFVLRKSRTGLKDSSVR